MTPRESCDMGTSLQSSAIDKSIDIRVECSYTAEDRSWLAGGEKDPNQVHSYQLQWRRTDRHLMVYRAGRLICHVGLLKHEVEISGEQIWVAGVGSVLTHKEYRGQGFGRAGLRAAEEFVLKEWGIDFMLLFCRPALEKWYGCLGWFRIDAPVWIEQDQGEDQGEILAPLPTLVKMLSPKPWPKSAVYLRSLPW
jgi:GNAT superfamily N-acetyltransferase